jgi:hypothetical protein
MSDFIRMEFFELHTPAGPRRMTRKEIEREYLLGTLAPTSFYDDNGTSRYVDTLVSDQARAEHARLARSAAPGAAAEEEWEQSNCTRGAYIALALFLGGLGIHNFYAKRMQGILQLIMTIFALFFIAQGYVEVAGLLVFVCFLTILIEVCTVEFDGDGCKLR